MLWNCGVLYVPRARVCVCGCCSGLLLSRATGTAVWSGVYSNLRIRGYLTTWCNCPELDHPDQAW